MSQANFNSVMPDRAIEVTTSDDSPNIFTALYIGGTGNVKITDRFGNVSTFVGVPAGQYIWIPTQLVWATGTTATNIVGLV